MRARSNILGADPRPTFFAVKDGAYRLKPPTERAGPSVRVAARSLSVMQKEALVASSASDKVWRLVSDEGAYLEGFDEAPCPLAFFTVGMVSSFMNAVLTLAKTRGIAIRDITLVQDNYYTMQGSALKGTMTGGDKDIDLEARIEGDADRDTLRDLLREAVAASPVKTLIFGEKESLFSLTLNGAVIEPAKARPIAAGELRDPCDTIAGAKPESEMPIVRKSGTSPVTAEITSSQGSSLADSQDRTLHIRGICTLREDGIKMIEQQLFNPHGSVFHFLCDEQGRAPDAASYIAAGLGFCFMTQLGRYAKIAKKDLAAYNIVQDIHLARGETTGGTEERGSAAPVETHVFLESGEDAAFARAALDMGEQTCFLHALCRTDLKVNVDIR